MTMAEQLRTITVPIAPVVWEGPQGTGPNGGVTQSMIGRFLNDMERFRVHAVEGLQPTRKFSHRVEYGNLFHLAEETHAGNGNWQEAVENYATDLCDKYPMHRAEVYRWYRVCLVQFPVYLDYWKSHPEQVSRTSLLQEQVFDVPYRLPSGRVVRLRGKWDGISLVGGQTHLDEMKTKGDVDRELIARNLTFDLQTCLYFVTIREAQRNGYVNGTVSKYPPVKGVRYNVIRRPLSGGKGTIVQKKGSKNVPAESDDEYFARLGQYIKDEPETYFYRWTTGITAQDIERFEAKFLRPFLEYLCDWYCQVTGDAWSGDPVPLHWTRPFGVPNYLDEAGFSDYDAYLFTGSTVGLKRVTNLFPELTSGG